MPSKNIPEIKESKPRTTPSPSRIHKKKKEASSKYLEQLVLKQMEEEKASPAKPKGFPKAKKSSKLRVKSIADIVPNQNAMNIVSEMQIDDLKSEENTCQEETVDQCILPKKEGPSLEVMPNEEIAEEIQSDEPVKEEQETDDDAIEENNEEIKEEDRLTFSDMPQDW